MQRIRYAKVTDFGCSKLRRTLRTTMSIDRGTINWSAPEVLRGTSDYTAVGTVAQLLHLFS
jgi:serine/threonine protein kinase